MFRWAVVLRNTGAGRQAACTVLHLCSPKVDSSLTFSLCQSHVFALPQLQEGVASYTLQRLQWPKRAVDIMNSAQLRPRLVKLARFLLLCNTLEASAGVAAAMVPLSNEDLAEQLAR
jgi:hypothetical protein